MNGLLSVYYLERHAIDVGVMNRELVWSVVLVVLMVFVTAVALYPLAMRLNRDLLRLSGDLAYANMGMLAALGNAVARRDRGTNAHNYRVTIYAILRKPGRLTPEETSLMKAHVRYGVEIVGKFEWLADAVDVIGCRHERVDGNGYPAGLKGHQIPIAARIFSVVDVFDALTTRRPYKAAISFEETMRTLEAGRGLAFDPMVLDAFAEVAPGLHRTFSGADEFQVARILDGLLVHYFPAPTGARRGREPPQMPALTPSPSPPTPRLEYLSGTWTLELPIWKKDSAGDLLPDEALGDDPFRKEP